MITGNQGVMVGGQGRVNSTLVSFGGVDWVKDGGGFYFKMGNGLGQWAEGLGYWIRPWVVFVLGLDYLFDLVS